MEALNTKIGLLEAAVEKYKEIDQIILELPNQIDHHIMVPLGKVAFVPGRIVHTNEI